MKTKVAIIGSGFGMYGLLPAFDNIEKCQVVAICAQKSERLEKMWGDRDSEKIYQDWKEMLDKEKPDAVAVAVIPSHQYEIAKYALEHNIAVFAEKPLTTSVATSLELLQLAKEKNLPNMVDFIFPQIPTWAEAKKIIDQGLIGKITSVLVEWSFLSYDLKNGITSWKTDVAQGGGALSFYFSHAFYYLEFFMGKIKALDCRTKTSENSKNHGETLVDVTAKFENGCIGRAHMDIDFAGPQKHRIEFLGEKGGMILESTSSGFVENFTLTVESGAGVKTITPTDSFDLLEKSDQDPRVKPVGMLAGRFVDWCNGGAPSKPDFEEGLRVQELIDQARLSSLKNHD